MVSQAPEGLSELTTLLFQMVLNTLVRKGLMTGLSYIEPKATKVEGLCVVLVAYMSRTTNPKAFSMTPIAIVVVEE